MVGMPEVGSKVGLCFVCVKLVSVLCVVGTSWAFEELAFDWAFKELASM